MPKYVLNTAGRLVGGISMATLGYTTLSVYINGGGTVAGGIPEFAKWVAAACFFLAGWNYLGTHVGYGGRKSIIEGIKGTFVGLVIASMVLAVLLMGRAFILGQYFDPYKAVFDWVRQIFDLVVVALTTPATLGVLVIGGAVVGLITGFANARWR